VIGEIRESGYRAQAICRSCADRLLLGVVVVIAGEFIVGLQIVRSAFDSLGFGVTAEIDSHGRGRGSLLFAQQKRNRGGARRLPFQRLIDGAAQCGRAIQIRAV